MCISNALQFPVLGFHLSNFFIKFRTHLKLPSDKVVFQNPKSWITGFVAEDYCYSFVL